jgi:uncharacterized protein YbjT (DUF2867 family)
MHVLLAGATGYLGSYLGPELLRRGHRLRVVVRSIGKLPPEVLANAEVIEAEVTRPDTLSGVCDGIEAVISTVGITRQRDGLDYQAVDYQANVNLLDEARRAGTQRFVYVSVLNGQRMQELAICAAKEHFVRRLKASGLSYSVLRPNGFFSDLRPIFEMARDGRVWLIGDGSPRANPIHGADLAEVCADALCTREPEIEIGGPDVLSQDEIAALAFDAIGQPPRLLHLPGALGSGIGWLAQRLLPVRMHGPLAFFLAVMSRDMLAPRYGKRRLAAHFAELAERGG